MMTLDDRQIKQFEAELKQFNARAYPFATRWTVHQAARLGAREAKAEVGKGMTLRNRYTVNSIGFAPRSANQLSLRVANQAAYTGSTQKYMETQEFGGVVKPDRGKNKPIPTSYSAGQDGAKPRTKLPKRPNTLRNIKLQRSRYKGKTPQQQTAVMIKQAIETGDRTAYLSTQRGRGIFRIVGNKRGAKIKMLHDLSRRSVVLKRTRWLEPSVERAGAEMPRLYMEALKVQLSRLGLFKG